MTRSRCSGYGCKIRIGGNQRYAQFLLLVVAGWVNRQQQDVIDYLQEENRVLRAGLRASVSSSLTTTGACSPSKAQALGREALAQIASVATPATLLRWLPLPHRSQVRWQQEPEPRPTSDGEGYP